MYLKPCNKMEVVECKHQHILNLLHNKPLTLVYLRVFDCLTHASTLKAHKTKFNLRAQKVMFLRYKEGANVSHKKYSSSITQNTLPLDLTSTRLKHKPNYLPKDIIAAKLFQFIVKYLISFSPFLSYSNFLSEYKYFCLVMSTNHESMNFGKASKHDC
ncbi:hypothetical protein CR513_34262, partial [Mucuna pruriens]